MEHNFYSHTAATWLRSFALTSAMAFTLAASAQTSAPQKPVNFKADAVYNKVVLTWEDPVQTQTLLTEGFEGEAFPSEGWSQKTTNTDYYMNTWFQFPSAEMEEEGIDDESRYMFVHGGKKSAVLYMDMNAPHEDESSAVQDEWLYLPKTPGAEYLTFYSYIDPMLLEYAEDETFPDHYYVKVSHDDGATWEILWDATTDMVSQSGFQKVKVYLGDASKGDPIVAFQGVSDLDNPDTGLFFAWAIDDIELSKSVGDKNSAPAEAYNVYLDDERIAENLHATTFTDLSDKLPGNHVYAVEAVSNTENQTSEKAEINVDIKTPTINPPTDVKLSYTESDTPGKYNVAISWKAPEGERKPVNYTVYCNNAMVAGFMEEMSLEQTGKPKGAYTYQVVANYEYPTGISDRELATACVAIGTRFPATGLTAKYEDNGDLTMTWDAPVESEFALKNYAVYRGNTKLGETDGTTFTEQQSPDGYYDYAVKAVYADGVESLPAVETMAKGNRPTYSLPFSEDFTGGLSPENWIIEKLDGKMQDQYLWRFDNWYEIPVTSGNFEGDFASISSAVAGYTLVWAVLDTPPLVRGELKDGEKTFLEFDIDYNATTKKSTEAGVYYSYNAVEWAPIETLKGYTAEDLADGETTKPEHKVYDITKCFTDDTTPVYLAWQYKGKLAQHMAIDNVRVYNGESASIAAANADMKFRVEGNAIVVGGMAGNVSVCTPSGMCLAEARLNAGDTATLPLAKGVNIISIRTADGVKTMKINK